MLIKLSKGSRKVTIEVSVTFINELQRFRQLKNEPESGGVLVGKRLLDGVISIVDFFSKPEKGDLQNRCRFSKKIISTSRVRE